MLLTFVASVMILYLPLPTWGEALPWHLTVSGVCALILLNGLACWGGFRLAVQAYDPATPFGRMQPLRLFRLLKLGIVGMVVLDVFALHWPWFVLSVFAACPQIPLADDLLLLAPVLLMILTAMAFKYRFERVARAVTLSLPQYLLLRFRTELAILLVPWLVLALVSDVVYAVWHGSVDYPAIDTAASLALLLMIVVFGPLLLRLIWHTSPLQPGPLRERLEALCRAQRVRCRNILVWHTYHQVPNAGVVGIVPWFRYVLLTDALLAGCTDEEVEAVFAHEIGHARQHHFAFYLLLGVAFMCFYANAIDLLFMLGWIDRLENVFAAELTSVQAIVMLVFGAVYWVFVFGYLSRRLEQQADLFSLRVASEPQAFISALRKIWGMSGYPGEATSWRHFSMARRVEFLNGVLRNPEQADRVNRRVRLMELAIGGLFVVAACRLLVRWLASFGA